MKLARNATIFGIIASALFVLESILYIFWNLKNGYYNGFFITTNLIHFIAAALLLVFCIMMCVYYNKRLSED